MNKFIKALLSTALVTGVLATVGIGGRIKAAEYDSASYKVSKSVYENDTATWDFTVNTNDVTLKTGDSVNGIIVDVTKGTVKFRPGYFDPFSGSTTNSCGGVFYVPVPEGSSGKVTMYGNGTNKTRYVYLNGNSTRSIQNIESSKNGFDVDEEFTANDITTYENKGSYLKFETFCTDKANKEFKTNKIIVSLTIGAYEASFKTYNATYFDGDEVLETKEMVEGTTMDYTPTKWGYNLEGLYTNTELSTIFDTTSTINADTNIYTKWTAWSNVIANPNTLDYTVLQKGYETFGVKTFVNDKKLDGTNYSVLNGATAFESKSVTIEGLGVGTAGIKTGGKMDESNLRNGLILHAKSSGVLNAYVRSNSSTAYSLDAFDANGKVGSSTATANNSGVSLLTVNIPAAGDYYIGAEGSISFYYVSFKQTEVELECQTTTIEDAKAVRFVGTIANVTLDNITNIEAVFTLDGVQGKKIEFRRVYTAVTNTKEAADNTYYAVYTITGFTDEYTGKELKGKFIITLTDGTTLTTNEVIEII